MDLHKTTLFDPDKQNLLKNNDVTVLDLKKLITFCHSSLKSLKNQINFETGSVFLLDNENNELWSIYNIQVLALQRFFQILQSAL